VFVVPDVTNGIPTESKITVPAGIVGHVIVAAAVPPAPNAESVRLVPLIEALSTAAATGKVTVGTVTTAAVLDNPVAPAFTASVIDEEDVAPVVYAVVT
jgi:phage tail sheath gpL-like